MDGKQCKKCREIKLLPEFNRRLTPAEARARGYKGDYLVTIESSLCRACRPRRRPMNQLTAKELQNKVTSGEISAFERKFILDERKKHRGMESALATRNRWLSVWSAELFDVLKPMQDEIESVERQARYARVSKKPHQVEFFENYAQTLRQQKAKIELDYTKNPRSINRDTDWAELMSGTVIVQTREAWGEIPLDERVRLKQPRLSHYRPKIKEI